MAGPLRGQRIPVIWFLVATRQERAATVVNRFATWMATVVVDEADGDSGVSGRVFAAFAAHIGDSTLRGREVWVAMTTSGLYSSSKSRSSARVNPLSNRRLASDPTP